MGGPKEAQAQPYSPGGASVPTWEGTLAPLGESIEPSVCGGSAVLCQNSFTTSWKKMLGSGNLILCRLAKCCDASMFALAAKYHIEPHDAVRSSVARIKDSFWFYFF